MLGPGERAVELRFWLMGREAEAISELLPEFERRNPGVHVSIQQLPWTAAHEQLPYGVRGDTLPDLPARQYVGSGACGRCALDSLDARAAASRRSAEDDYFAGIWDTNRIDGVLRASPGTSTSGSSSTARTSSRRRASTIHRVRGTSGRARCAR